MRLPNYRPRELPPAIYRQARLSAGGGLTSDLGRMELPRHSRESKPERGKKQDPQYHPSHIQNDPNRETNR